MPLGVDVAGGQFHHRSLEDFMFKFCLPRAKSSSSSVSNKQRPSPAAAAAENARKSRESNTSLSASDRDVSGITFTPSKEDNSRESQLSTSSTSSSLAGIRELLPDGPLIYRYSELAKATDNFSDGKKVGASVFRAWLRNADVAVVRKKGSFVGNFVELIKIICSAHHVNLVKVLGACFRESDYVYVCYEFESGANLREALQSSKAEGFTVLSKWTSRLQVALDIALGIEYLHDHTMPSFVHKHIKSTNILVTNDLRAKIAKFGIPQLIGEIQPLRKEEEPDNEIQEQGNDEGGDERRRKLTRSNSVKITGTPGYMSPEYMANGIVTSKMDVYAYGIVLLELLSGQQPGVQMDPVTRKLKVVSLPDKVKEVMRSSEPKKKLRLWMDPKLKDSFPVDIALSVAALAKQCVETDPALRPPMKNVTAKLSNYLYSSQEWEKSYLAFRELGQPTESFRGVLVEEEAARISGGTLRNSSSSSSESKWLKKLDPEVSQS